MCVCVCVCDGAGGDSIAHSLLRKFFTCVHFLPYTTLFYVLLSPAARVFGIILFMYPWFEGKRENV